MDESAIQRLKKLAETETLYDTDTEGAECYDGHATDTYDAGARDGEITLARELLDELQIAYTVELEEVEED